MPHYLVTGGAGFIGSAAARALLARGDRVTILDNLSTGDRDNVPPAARFVMADLGSEQTWAEVDPEGIDAVLHLGAQSSGEVSHLDPVADFDTNARGTFLLLRWAERHDITRVLFASSMAVYGAAEGPLPEDRPLLPVSFYGVSKTTGEAAVSHFARRGGAATVLRMFSVYGPGQNLANLRQGMASIYLAYLLQGEPVLVKGSLDRYRDLVHIDDVVDAWVRAIDNPAAIGGVFNIGTGVKTTVGELVETLIAAFGRAPDDYPVTVAEPTPGDIQGSIADITRITRTLGWRPRVALADGIAGMVAWARQQSAGVRQQS